MDSSATTSSSPVGEVRIRVKSASHRCEDIEISCQISSSVKNVKQIIKKQYPLHPEIEEQRIIYAGHLLEDDQVLRDIFLQGGQVSISGGYTFHLACNSTFLRKTTTAEEGESKTKGGQTEECNAQETQNPPVGVPVGGVPQDLLALHQLYVEQMMNFMSQWSQGTMGPGWMPAPTMIHGMGMTHPGHPVHPFTHAPIPPPVINQPLLDDQRILPNEAPVAAPVQRNIDGDEEQPRDILDWLYTCSRLVLILSVVYFYSNFARFLLVLLFTALVMFVQRRPGLLNGLRRGGQANPPQPIVQEQAPPRNENNMNNAAPEADPVEQAAGAEDQGEGEMNAEVPSPADELPAAEAQAQAQQQQQRFHPFDITRTFLMTFFTSLIPEINPN